MGHVQVQTLVVRLAVADLALGVAVGLGAGARLAVLAPSGLVLVLRIVLLVLLTQPLGLLDEGPLVIFIQQPGLGSSGVGV